MPSASRTGSQSTPNSTAESPQQTIELPKALGIETAGAGTWNGRRTIILLKQRDVADLGRDWWAEHPNYLREFRRATAQLFAVGDRQQRAIDQFERLMAASSSTSG